MKPLPTDGASLPLARKEACDLEPADRSRPTSILATCSPAQMDVLRELESNPVPMFKAARLLGLSREKARPILEAAGVLAACLTASKESSRQGSRREARRDWRALLAAAVDANQSNSEFALEHGLHPQTVDRVCRIQEVQLRTPVRAARWLKDVPDLVGSFPGAPSGRLRFAYVAQLTDAEKRMVERLHSRSPAEMRAGR